MKSQLPTQLTVLQKGDILLRALDKSDAPVIASLINNKKIWDNIRDYIPHPYTLENALEFIDNTQKEAPTVTFAITYQGQIAGVIGLVPLTDVYKKTASLGYWLGEPFWGKGIATVALKLLTHYGLYQLGFIRMETTVFEYNPASMRVLEKNGYLKEGIFRKAIFKNEQIWDEHRYGIVRED